MSEQTKTTAAPPPAERAESVQEHGVAAFFKKPLGIAAVLGLAAIAGLIAWLEYRAAGLSIPPPEVSYELLRNEGLTDGVPIVIKIGPAAVFKIDDPMQNGAARAKEVVASLERFIQDLVDQPGRDITLSYEGDLPAIVQSLPDGGGLQEIVRLTPGDVTLSGHSDPKWVARLWAERLTDALKVFQFGESPRFTEGSEFGSVLSTLHADALAQRGAISKRALNEAYAELSEGQRSALIEFPVPEETASANP